MKTVAENEQRQREINAAIAELMARASRTIAESRETLERLRTLREELRRLHLLAEPPPAR